MRNDETKLRRVPRSMMPEIVKLAEVHLPAIRGKPFDLTGDPVEILIDAAVPEHELANGVITTIQIAARYLWLNPTREQIQQQRPWWSQSAVEDVYQNYVKHVKKWGPDDLELVTLTFERSPISDNSTSLDPIHFHVESISYRSGATREAVLDRIVKWKWDKIARYIVTYHRTETVFRGFERLEDGRIILCIDSYHHSLFEAGRDIRKQRIDGSIVRPRRQWSRVVTPSVRAITDEQRFHYQIMEKNRGYLDWEVS
ncbi:hypothetical protein KJ733_05245 [Patescibacteria group bacterium]|nr:hypothetical protein [Patescibacteria group bacterium]